MDTVEDQHVALGGRLRLDILNFHINIQFSAGCSKHYISDYLGRRIVPLFSASYDNLPQFSEKTLKHNRLMLYYSTTIF